MVLKLIKLLNADVHTFTDTDALTNQSVGHKKYKQPQKPQNKARQLSTWQISGAFVSPRSNGQKNPQNMQPHNGHRMHTRNNTC